MPKAFSIRSYLAVPSLLIGLFIGLLAPVHSSHANTSHIKLPELGDSVSGSISAREEALLGKTWLSIFRARAPIQNDPLLNLYTEDLLYRLASHSELKSANLELVIVKNKTLNAFAVPGGVIGLHDGLFLLTENEDQLASVVSHELAHLSQRHYARSREEAKRNSIPTFAAILAGIVLAATAGTDAGLAAITATQAVNAQNQLAFSRLHEQEADRIGMKTLYNAGFNPSQVPAMFEVMQRNDRYYSKNLFAFLRTHPLTDSRITDTRLRAQQYPKRPINSNIMFDLMRARVQVLSAETPGAAVKQAKALTKKNPNQLHRYRLALAYLQASQPEKAAPLAKDLYKKHSDSIVFQLLQAQLHQAQGKLQASRTLLAKSLKLSPGNHALTMQYAQVLLQLKQFPQAAAVLNKHSKRRPNDPEVWFLLAETYGLAGNILGVHESRAEYFALTGSLERAEKQLNYAINNLNLDSHSSQRIHARIDELQNAHILQKKLLK